MSEQQSFLTDFDQSEYEQMCRMVEYVAMLEKNETDNITKDMFDEIEVYNEGLGIWTGISEFGRVTVYYDDCDRIAIHDPDLDRDSDVMNGLTRHPASESISDTETCHVHGPATVQHTRNFAVLLCKRFDVDKSDVDADLSYVVDYE